MVKKIIPILVLAVLTGCSGELSHSSDDDQKEYILTQLNDYQGLIEIYRKKLSVKDNADERYYLSELYNKIGDYSSSNIYLQPLLNKSTEQRYLVLHVKNLLELGREKECEEIINNLLVKNNSSGELWNLQGVLFAQQSQYDKAIKSFTKARGLFYNEEVVINNLAMMEILQQNYPKARDYLLELYSRKKYQRQTVYNLVYTLAKTNDDESARKIIFDEKLTTSDPYKLIYSLKRLSPKEQLNIASSDDDTKVQNEVQVGEQNSLANTQPQEVKKTSNIVKPDVPAKEQLSCIPQVYRKGHPVAFNDKIANAKKISGLTAGTLNNGNAVALYSSYPLNYMILPQENNNQLSIQLFNAMPGEDLYSRQLSILKKYPDINNVEFKNNGDGNISLTITTDKCIADKRIKRAPGNDKYKEKLLIEFFY
jgi:Flp pilus assembly protein TadD